ncbi:MAG: DUF3999 family protein [Opitutaceae bacterium]
MNLLRILAPLAALVATTLAAALDTTAWEFRQTVTLDAAGPVRLTLPAETLDAARPDLADLRLLGPDGAELPFAIVRRNTRRPTVERIPTQARVEARATIVELGLAKEQPIQRLRIETPAAYFTKGATVEIEEAPGRWTRAVDSALVFRMGGNLEQTTLDLGGRRARTLRLTLDDAEHGPIPITAVIVETGGNEAEELIDLPATIVAAEPEAGATRFTFDLGLRHRPLAELVLAAREGVFQRNVRLVAQRAAEEEIVEDTLATGTLARLSFPGGRHFEQLALKVDAAAPAARLELVVENGDSPALTDVRLTARLRRVDIGFEAPAAGTYTLLAGAPAAAAPRYDVAAFGADWGRLPSTTPRAEARTANPGYRPAQLPIDVPEFGGPIDSKTWTHRRDVILVASGAQVLELDPTALALSRPDFSDLRLVRGDRQVPYLLERTSRQRGVPLTLVAAPDAKRPTVGAWELALPVAGLPVTSVRVVIEERVFARTLLVGESVPDSRGQPWRRILGSASVQRRSADDPTAFTVALSARPQTHRLFLEIDHGDNAAFAPVKAEALYPVRRLRFRATDTTGCALLYGNDQATAPRYDLQLAAPRLLVAPQNTATLRATAGLESGRTSLGFGGPAARFAFWGALALVVALLVWLVAKLLPKPPTA